MPLGAGEKLGPYGILAPLGAGGSQPLEVIVNWPALLKKGIADE
jgi:hypothetical protein